MSKGRGEKIAIKFTEELVGDVTGNEKAFTILGKEREHINGALIEGDYKVDKIERHPTEEKTILLIMNPLKRFHNVEGNITIIYDEQKGKLAGIGGRVESFEHSFIPTDLILLPNPYIRENVKVGLVFHIGITQKGYPKLYSDHEHIKATLTNCKIEIKDIGSITP